MDFKFFRSARSTGRIQAAFAAVALGSVAVLAAGTLSQPAHAAQTGLAYDEVTRFVMSGQATPQPGTFAADFQAAVDASKSMAETPKHGGLLGSIMNAGNMAKNAMNMVKVGVASRDSFMGAWERTDDLGAQTATIRRPDQHQVIHLNLAKKTYRIEDTSVAPAMETPPPYQPNQNPQGGASPQPGTGHLDITVSNSMLGPKVIENVPTTGYNMSFKIASTNSTGSCKDGTFQMGMINYVSRYADPHVSTMSGMAHRSSLPRPETMAMHPGCNPSIKTHQSGGASPPGDRLAMWTLVSLTGSAQTDQGPMGGRFGTLIERGNVRTLGSGDSNLFNIPPGFIKE
ncbi:MAG: hypothetical protein DLM53_06045 [Candidatus Eremiobacter antarcticus]|nr:hypothetical protein [Candidatus Eremiobacteraeota bacterium]PZR62378.1 MAG: hypothetical protein DLM53_06045 [Candidatus Eremiobacter sp. RRmetagenome_bin22]